ncbi:hypothetical protein [Radicibacter daui]|uniref:hypothetical protein n=1 Tax=Radicibacter daui TaxID=3064829 RepID=UPI004046F3E1
MTAGAETPGLAVAPAAPAGRRALPILAFLGGLLVCGLLTLRVLDHGYISEALAARWTSALMVTSDAAAFRDLVAVNFPPLPLWFDMILAGLPATGGLPLPALASVLIAAILAGLWSRQLAAAGYGAVLSFLLALLFLAQPMLQQRLAEGSGLPFGLVAMSLMAPAASRVRRYGNVTALSVVGGGVAIIFFSDPAGIYLLLALLPFLVALAPPAFLARAPGAVLLVILFPVGIGLLGYLYSNWLFGASPFAFAHQQGTVLKGAADNAAMVPWLTGWGHTTPGAALAAALMALIALPVIPPALLRAYYPSGRYVGILLVVAVLVAVLLATATLFLAHPAQLLAYLVPVAVFALCEAGPRRLQGGLALLLALIGLAGGWLMQGFEAPAETNAWRSAIEGTAVDSDALDHDLAFGTELRRYDDVALDAASAGMVLPSRLDASGIALPNMERIKADLLFGALSTRYVAVQEPASERGRLDRIGRAIPDLWRHGPPGGTLVVEEGPWRLWRTAVPPGKEQENKSAGPARETAP